MKRSSVVAALVAGMVALLLVAAPAFADHDHGKGKSNHGANNADGTPGSTAGTNGHKAEESETGTKPFDDNPNDHPSGNDKTEEPGGSGTQGNSTSDPDGMANGGADKPGGTGGFDDDKDGNNGCGNDDDFEDDNNGWCGKADDVAATDAVEVQEAAALPSLKKLKKDEVLGLRLARAPSVSVADVLAARQAIRPSVKVRGEILPFTGSEPLLLVAVALGLLALGTLTYKVATRKS
ncbi:MAG: hypothetical protein M3345_05530 [Actinomycetota bacterium]|nr:hypothetical protein [Actinomycetota bacterium]